jgi:hypothetical protein
MINLVKAKEKYVPNIGDLVCEWSNKESVEYLVAEKGMGTEKVIPLACAHPNPWKALDMFDICATPIIAKYKCPYTNYEHFAILPVQLLINGNVDAYKHLKHWAPEYVLDWEWHKELMKERRFEIQAIQRILLGSGYTGGTGFNDGHGGLEERRVMLDNGDALWVIFWEWYNK